MIKKILLSSFLYLAVNLNASAGSLLMIEDPVAKSTVAGQKVSAIFAKITSPIKGKIIKAESPSAKIVQIHEMAHDKGVMSMREIPALALDANKPIELKAGGLHIMLIELKAPLKAGDSVPVKLTFQAEGAGSPPEAIDFKAIVKDLDNKKHSH